MNTKLSYSSLTAFALIGLIQTASAADVTGKVTFKGTPPPEVTIPFDPSCGKFHTQKATTRHFLLGPGGELADVFVYVKEGAKPTPPPTEPVVLDQVGCLYTPYIFGIQTGQKLIIKNSDRGILHNVHVDPNPQSGNKKSNQAQLTGQDLVKTFEKPEILLHFKCDVHNWMHAYANVMEHPYFAVSAKDGSYKIANLPPGKYVIEAVHRKAGKQTREITVTDKGLTENFAFELPAK